MQEEDGRKQERLIESGAAELPKYDKQGPKLKRVKRGEERGQE